MQKLDLFTMAHFSLNTKLAVYALFGKNKIKFGQNFFASPKISTPVHLCPLMSFLKRISTLRRIPRPNRLHNK